MGKHVNKFVEPGHVEKRGGRKRKIMNVKDASHSVMVRYKAGAFARGIEWDLYEMEFYDLITSPCHYTGIEPEKKVKMKKGFFYHHGVDRKDSSLGYTWSNCVPCCEFANYAKRAKSYKDFIKWLDQVALFRRKDENGEYESWILG